VIVDTNVVLRLIIDEGTPQCVEAAELFNEAKKLLITDVVISEAVYILRAYYKKSRYEILDALTIVVELSNVVCDVNLVKEYLGIYVSTSLDIVDCYLIAYSLRSGEELKTFDKKMLDKYQEQKTKS
jgi:predicted nucleic acid-binding protein